MPVFLGLVVVLFMIIAAPEEYWEEIKSTTSDETLETGTGAQRMYTWEIGWEMFLGNPIMGVGQGNFPWTFEEYQGDRTFQDRSLAGRAAHSLYFTLLPELGLVGFGLFMGMLLHSFKDLRWVSHTAVRYGIRKAYPGIGKEMNHPEDVLNRDKLRDALFFARAIEAAFIGYLVSSIFVSTLYYPTFWVLTALAVSLRNCVAAEMRLKDSDRDNANGLKSLEGTKPVGFFSSGRTSYRRET
jgi:hypothetical protein